MADIPGKEPHEQPSSRRYEEVLEEYIDRLNAGERFDPVELWSKHPDFAEELIDHLETFANIESHGEASPVGTLGDYTLRRQIGRGGMGVVYEAWQNSVERRVALKVLPGAVAADDKAFHRFMREARTAAKLNHQNIVGVYGMGQEEHTPYYAMKLGVKMRKRKKRSQKLSNCLWLRGLGCAF